jgi:hypothetical protein
MLDERTCEPPPPEIVSKPEPRPPELAKGTSERSKESVQCMLLAGALAFKRDPASLSILRPVDDAIADHAHTTPCVQVVPAAAPLAIRKPASPVAPCSSIPQESERALFAILECGAQLGETIDAHNRRKERELGALFATLSVLQARALHKRLSSPAADDPIATRFARMIAERRHRLLVFLADARRREAIHTSRR